MLTQLSIHNLRNLQSVNMQVARCNVIVGANGSGKTSLLESLFLLSRGKSFRHHQPKRYISHHQPCVTVYARFSDNNSMAIQKAQDASTQMRLAQQPVYVQSALTRQLPTLLIDPSSMDILEVGSSSRRQMLDWITFHVKQGFHSQWMSYQRLLKQRNALLKKSFKLSELQQQELASWDKGLSNHADLITYYRKQVFDAWKLIFDDLIQQLLPEYAPFIQLRFVAGYNTEVPLDELLAKRLQQDCQMGYTRIGCHRSDVQVLWIDDAEARQEVLLQEKLSDSDFSNEINDIDFDDVVLDKNSLNSKATNDNGSHVLETNSLSDNEFSDDKTATVREQAANVLSRGEKKLLITALKLSQLPLLEALNKPQNHNYQSINEKVVEKTINEQTVLPLVLLDDITAELDEKALDILLKTLSELSCQVFITSLDDSVVELVKKYWPSVQLFHMKQGEVEAIK